MNDVVFSVFGIIFCIRDSKYRFLKKCAVCKDFDEYVWQIDNTKKTKKIVGVSCMNSYSHYHICNSCGSSSYFLKFFDYKKHIHICQVCGAEKFSKVFVLKKKKENDVLVYQLLVCPFCGFLLNDGYRKNKMVQCKCGKKFFTGEAKDGK